MFNSGLTSAILGLYLNAIGAGNTIHGVTLASGAVQTNAGWFVALDDTDSLWAAASVGTFVVAGFGALLDGDPT